MKLSACTSCDTGHGEVNIGILQDPRMPELQELADRLSERLNRPINFAQAFSLALSAMEAGAVKVPGALWRGDWAAPSLVDAIVGCVSQVPQQDLDQFLVDLAFADCEREYREWKAQQPEAEPWPGHVDEPPSRKCDGVGYPDEGFAMYIWLDNVLYWKKLARRLSWRFGRRLNYVHAFFLYYHALHYTQGHDVWTRLRHCVYTREVADVIQLHLTWLEAGFLDELLAMPEFYAWEQQYQQALDDANLLSRHQRMVVTTPMSVRHLVAIEEESPDEPTQAVGSQKVAPLAMPLRQITVCYSRKDDEVGVDERHVPHWMRLARLLGERIGRRLNFAHVCSIFGWALHAGDLPCVKGRWRGCVYSPEVVEILAEYLAMTEPESLDRLLASRMHQRFANEYKMRLQAKR